MLCQQITRNLANLLPDRLTLPCGRAIDRVDIHWRECRRVLRATSRGGRAIRATLPRGQRVSHGDVLLEDDEAVVVVNVEPCEVIVVPLVDVSMAATLSLELGNLHLPVSIDQNELCFPPDETAIVIVDALVGSCGGGWTKEVRRFEPRSLIGFAGVQMSPAFAVVRSSGST